MSSRILTLLALVLLSLGLRGALAARHGLWTDEIFSLSMATSHSLEHPADVARPELGDFVQEEAPVTPAGYRRYMEHEEGSSLSRVYRAVVLSDTSPPAYYLALYFWTLLFGTGDLSLRGMSIFWAILTIPLLMAVARRLGGRGAMLPSAFLVTMAPLGILYDTEGRMYSQLVFFTVLAAWSTLELRRRRAGLGRCVLWTATAALGLLTHYFFVFPWLAMCAWLALTTRRPAVRWRLAGCLLATGLLILPWYAGIPEGLAQWRVTAGWLEMEGPPEPRAKLLAYAFLDYFNAAGSWTGDWKTRRLIRGAALALLAAALVLGGRRLPWRRQSFLVLWLLASVLGPAVFDQLMGTWTVLYPRYMLTGLPAVMLLIGSALGKVAAPLRAALCLAFGLLFGYCFLGGYALKTRSYCPMREVAEVLDREATAEDVVILHSIPSGLAGVARYMESEVPVVDWVGQLGTREVPGSLEQLARGSERIFVVQIHTVGEPAPQLDYLRENARAVEDWNVEGVSISAFDSGTGRPQFETGASDSR